MKGWPRVVEPAGPGRETTVVIGSHVAWGSVVPLDQDLAALDCVADGHVDPILGNRFPRALSSGDPPDVVADKKMENLCGPTIYADPAAVFQ